MSRIWISLGLSILLSVVTNAAFAHSEGAGVVDTEQLSAWQVDEPVVSLHQHGSNLEKCHGSGPGCGYAAIGQSTYATSFVQVKPTVAEVWLWQGTTGSPPTPPPD